MMLCSAGLIIASVAGLAGAQVSTGSPQDYPGKPSGDYSPEWQTYFEVTSTLPNVTFPISRNWAGNIPVNRQDHPDNSLFFWGFEKENGSLTAAAGERNDEPWGIWLNGGPGSSSMLGLLYENGPLHLNDDLSMYSNNYSWDKLVDYFWLDQPVGTGFSTCDESGFATSEEQVAADFVGFLTNLVKVFPSLQTRPLYITGESYAGTYIPYMTKALLGMDNPPANVSKIAIGDGAIGQSIQFADAPVLSAIETYPQLIAYDRDVYNYFAEQSRLCGFDVTLTYPQKGHFPTFRAPAGARVLEPNERKRELVEELIRADPASRKRGLVERDWYDGAPRVPAHARRNLNAQWKRDLSGRANGTIDPYYQCNLQEEIVDYALNFSVPWMGHSSDTGFDTFNIPNALYPRQLLNGGPFFNNAVTRSALHAPTNKNWDSDRSYPWGGNVTGRDPSVKPMAFMSELATNATERGMRVILYSGNDGLVAPHLATEFAIQNTTFGGIQGFTRKPSTPWFDDEGELGGIVHQERNWTYVLVAGGGHRLPQQQPGRAFVLLREFILGTNTTGSVVTSGGNVTVVGGESASSIADIFPGQTGIPQGSGTTASTYFFPSATIDAWNGFVATAPPSRDTGSNGASSLTFGISWSLLTLCTILVALWVWA